KQVIPRGRNKPWSPAPGVASPALEIQSGSDILPGAPGPAAPNGHPEPKPERKAAGAAVRAAVEDCIRRGWHVIELHPRTKSPLHKDWQKSPVKAEDLREGSTSLHPELLPRNVGLLLGYEGSRLVDVALDCAEAVDAADYLLPETGREFGRKSRRHSHHLYVVQDPGRSLQLV